MENNIISQKLLEIIQCIQKNKVNFSKESEELFYRLDMYNDALSKIENDIFSLLDFPFLMDDIDLSKRTDYFKLIELLRVLRNSDLVTLTSEQIKKIRNSKEFMSCINGLLRFKGKYIAEYEGHKALVDRNNLLDEIIEKLKANGDKIIDDDLVEEIYGLIFNKVLDEGSSLELGKLIFEYNSLVFESMKEQSSVLIEHISDDELDKIFKQYGYDYSKVSDELKSKLRVRGNIERINEVFDALAEYHIPFKENDIISICLLLKSDRDAIERIIDLSKKYSFDFYKVIGAFPSIIMHKGRHKKRSNSTGLSIVEVSGSFEDFEDNIRVIEGLGYDLKTAFEKSMSVFVVPNSKIVHNINSLMQYGFPEKLARVGFKLSGLKSDHITSNIDKFIELGEIEYVQNNTSRLSVEKDSFIFYRLYFAKKYNDSIKNNPKEKPYLIKKKQKNKYILTGIISTKNNGTLNDKIDMSSLIHCVFDDKIDFEISEYIEEKEKEGYTYEMVFDDTINDIENNYSKNRIMYDFDGVIVSRLKLLRIYSLLISKYPDYPKKQILLFAATYNSIMNQEDFNKVKSIITKEKTK